MEFLFSLSQKAQSGPVFRLLIAAVLSMFITAIIMSMIAMLNKQKYVMNLDEVKDICRSAANAPTLTFSKPIIYRGLTLEPGFYSEKSLARYFGVPEGCVVWGSNSGLVSVEENGLRIRKVVSLTVKAGCTTGAGQGDPPWMDDALSTNGGGSADCPKLCYLLFKAS